MVHYYSQYLNPYHWPLLMVGRFRLGGQVLLGIVNIKPKEIAMEKLLQNVWQNRLSLVQDPIFYALCY